MSAHTDNERSEAEVDAPRFVRGWAELAEVPDSETHYLEIDVRRCNGWIREKGNKDALGHYLSTHTFYGLNHKDSTAILRKCGFNVTLANWDAPNAPEQKASQTLGAHTNNAH